MPGPYPAEVVGRTPWSARVPPDPHLARGSRLSRPDEADGGVGSGPGGPPNHEKYVALG